MGLSNKIVLFSQDPQSPDENCCDLGFFCLLQADYNQKLPCNSKDIIAYVEESFRDYPHERLNRLWFTHMSCMNSILDSDGNNVYKITRNWSVKETYPGFWR